MKIAICDDEKNFVKKIYEYLRQQPDCTVECFLSPSVLLKKYEAGEQYDVLFLDVLMKPINGMSLAKRIRNYDSRAIIVFLTAYVEYAPAGYEVNAFRYLLKPISVNDLLLVMKDIRYQLTNSFKVLLKTPQCELIVHTDDILYLEANNKDSTVFYETDSVTLRKGLNELSSLFPPTLFFRIHRKYVVNLSRVRELDEDHVTLDCGKTLPVSRRKSREFRDALQTYIEGGLR